MREPESLYPANEGGAGGKLKSNHCALGVMHGLKQGHNRTEKWRLCTQNQLDS